MTDTLTPVLSANWADERSWKITNYERRGGYQALKRILGKLGPLPPEGGGQLGSGPALGPQSIARDEPAVDALLEHQHHQTVG